MNLWPLGAAALGVALPHAVGSLRLASPPVAAAIWLGALILRAVVVAAAVLVALLYLPATSLFALTTEWCWHFTVPLLQSHVGFSGHQAGDVVTLLPAVALAASGMSAAWTVARAARSVRIGVRDRTLGPGPANTTLVGGAEVVLAAAGFARPRVVVSAGALTALDEGELAAGLAHERGHIARGHRFVLVLGELCRALARWLPGTETAASQLRLHVERDADAYAVARCHDPLDLASAICKARPAATTAVWTSLGAEPSAAARVLELMDPPPTSSPSRDLRAQGLATVIAAALLVLVASMPALAADGVRHPDLGPAAVICPR